MRKPSEKKMARYRNEYIGRLAVGKYDTDVLIMALDVYYERDTFWINYYCFNNKCDYNVELNWFECRNSWLTAPLVTP